jgi:hypothetical protein
VSFDGPWQIFGAGAKTVAVGQSMSFHHRLSNRSGGPLSFNVVLQSDPSLVWRLYGGSSSAPNLGQPLTGPIQVANQATKDVWAVCNPLTADARRGPGALIVTAAPTTQPTASRWASDLFYVGEWVAPAPPSDAHRVYLPIAR